MLFSFYFVNVVSEMNFVHGETRDGQSYRLLANDNNVLYEQMISNIDKDRLSWPFDSLVPFTRY
jgi:hypothetical protein